MNRKAAEVLAPRLAFTRVETDAQLVPLTVEQYHGMIEARILAEGAPIELLDGFLVRKDRSKAGGDPMTVGHHHAWVVDALTNLAGDVVRLGARLRIQQPITLPPDDEPEPDATIFAAGDFRERHPGPADIFCVVEAADSSLRHDRTTKQRIYASHGIPQYVIVNLEENVIEDYRRPDVGAGRYDPPVVLRRGQTVSFELGGDRRLDVAVESLLP